MAKRGRPAKSHAERVLTGNAGKRKMPDPDTAPLPEGRVVTVEQQQTEPASFGAPLPPEHLSEVAKVEWVRLAKLMVDRGLLRELDMLGFEMRCETYATWRQARKVLDTGGLTYEHNGLQKKRPEVGIVAECARAIQRFDSEYGLTPAARSRTTMATGEGGGRQPSLPGMEQPQQPAAAKPAPTSAPTPPARPEQLDDEAFLAGPRVRLN